MFTFSLFWTLIGVVIRVTLKEELNEEASDFVALFFFCSNFKFDWENGVWTKIL